MVIDTHAKAREKSHSKLLSYHGRQVLAHLLRDESDALSVVMQVWVASTDEQLRVAVTYPGLSDEVVTLIFEALDDEKVAIDFETMGIDKILAESADG